MSNVPTPPTQGRAATMIMNQNMVGHNSFDGGNHHQQQFQPMTGGGPHQRLPLSESNNGYIIQGGQMISTSSHQQIPSFMNAGQQQIGPQHRMPHPPGFGSNGHQVFFNFFFVI